MEKQRWEESERRRAEERRSKKSNSEKKTDGLSIFGRSDVILRGRCKGFYTLPKASKT